MNTANNPKNQNSKAEDGSTVQISMKPLDSTAYVSRETQKGGKTMSTKPETIDNEIQRNDPIRTKHGEEIRITYYGRHFNPIPDSDAQVSIGKSGWDVALYLEPDELRRMAYDLMRAAQQIDRANRVYDYAREATK